MIRLGGLYRWFTKLRTNPLEGWWFEGLWLGFSLELGGQAGRQASHE